MAWQAETQLQDGRYVIEKTLGVGGFGITYLARETTGDRVVIKTLNDTVQKRRDFNQCQEEFLNEALRLAQCSHPHIVRVQKVIQHDSIWCIVMDYIDGMTLAKRVEEKGFLSESLALQYIQQIADAANLIHQRGFLHRDIKPLNILLTEDEQSAFLIDFGMVRSFKPNLTQVHTEYVSKGFAPIEQYDRRSQRGAYTDVYGLAATLYAILTGEVPESATTRDRAVAKGESDPLVLPQTFNPNISDRTQAVILQGMALLPEQRSPSVLEWLSGLPLEENVATASEIELVPPPLPDVPQWQSAVGIDYSQLNELLANHRWQEADRETEAIVLQVCDRMAAGTANIDEIQNFPCRDLRSIDLLWEEHSNGRFGFRVQAKIWQEVEENYEAFGEKVGWRELGIWLPYAELTFEISAPVGHLPSWGRRGRLWSFFADRIDECR
jgi:eukaryotic-like serine/threonine-protein kinase